MTSKRKNGGENRGSYFSGSRQTLTSCPSSSRRSKRSRGGEKDREEEGDDQKMCGICLKDEGRAVRGQIDCCDHYFCFICIMEWAKKESLCPMCKQRFRSVRRPPKDGVFACERIIHVPIRDQVHHPLQHVTSARSNPHAHACCSECQSSEDEHHLLFCALCSSASHTYCVGLGVSVAQRDWYCHDCTISRNEYAENEVSSSMEASNTRSSSPMFDDLFASQEHLERYAKDYSFRGVMLGRCVDFDFFSREGFPFKQMIKRIGWFPFFTMQESTYPRLVKIFYANLHWNETKDVLQSYVKGVPIQLSQTTLGTILQCPNRGIKSYEHSCWPLPDQFPAAEAVELMTGNRHLIRGAEAVKPAPSDMTVNFRILHHMLTFIVVPKAGHRDETSYAETVILWGIGSGTALNLPFIVQNHMHHSTTRSNALLPYGMLLSKVFRHFGVDMTGEEMVSLRKKYDFYNEATLVRMNLVRTADHGWIPKNLLDNPQAEPAGHQGEEAQEEAIPQQPTYHGESSSARHSLDDLYEQLSALRATVNSMQEEQHEIRGTQQQLYAEVKQLYAFLLKQYSQQPRPPQ